MIGVWDDGSKMNFPAQVHPCLCPTASANMSAAGMVSSMRSVPIVVECVVVACIAEATVSDEFDSVPIGVVGGVAPSCLVLPLLTICGSCCSVVTAAVSDTAAVTADCICTCSSCAVVGGWCLVP